MTFKFADLFAGIGGFHSGLERFGGECVFVSEINSDAYKTYEQNWNLKSRGTSWTYIADVREAADNPSKLVDDHDVLVAGFPCQPFSKSGQQRGVDDDRGTLFHDIVRILEVKKPKLVLLENVRNLIGPKHLSDYELMLEMLRDAGYAVSNTPTIISPHEIPESLGGTPQHRQRLFIGGVYVGKRQAKRLRDMPPLLMRQPFGSEISKQWSVKKFLVGKHHSISHTSTDTSMSLNQEVAIMAWQDFLDEFRSRHPGEKLPGVPLWSDFWTLGEKIPKAAPEWKLGFIATNQNFYDENRRWIDRWYKKHQIDNLIPSFRKFEWQAQDAKKISHCLIQFRPSGIRIKKPNYVPTFVAMSQTPYLGWKNRALKPEEATLLQGFPTNFNFGEQNSAATMKQIGNAVHPGVVSVVFDALCKQANEIGVVL